jgi:phosphate transport system protein
MTDNPRHILGSYDHALFAVQNDLLMMASLCEQNLRNSLECLLKRDDNLCNITISDDVEIDQLEKRVDKNGIDLLRRFQPVAGDLRHVVAAMKLAGNLERIADQSVNIARKARRLNRTSLMAEVNFLDPMYLEVTSMLSDVVRAYTESNVELAISIPSRDKKLDDLNHGVTENLTALMAKFPERITEYLDLIFIARHLERAGDHVKEIAEDLVYAIAAEDIRHMGDQRPGCAADLLGKRSGESAAARADDTLIS